MHQSANRKWILEKYGNEICLLDATYKTTKNSIPLFFLVVKINVDYQIAGSFAVQDEITDAIFEVVAILKSWNNKWKPLVFMVDNCDEEIKAIGNISRVAIITIMLFVFKNRLLGYIGKSKNCFLYFCNYSELFFSSNHSRVLHK